MKPDYDEQRIAMNVPVPDGLLFVMPEIAGFG
jgi:hypothetical protein